MADPQNNPQPAHVVHVHRASHDPKAYRALAIASWLLIALTFCFALVPLLGFASWLIIIPVFLATFIMAIVILTRGGTLQGILLLLTSMFFGPGFVFFAPFVSSYLGIGGVVAAVAIQEAAAREHNASTEEPTPVPEASIIATPAPAPLSDRPQIIPEMPVTATPAASLDGQSATPPAVREQPPLPIRENQVSVPKPTLAPLSHESNPAEDFAQGKAFSKGEGVAQNHPEAARYYRRAADRGYAPAQHQLGVAYAKGWGVERNDEEAVIWYRKAAEQGLPEAQHDLGVRYILGLGTTKDITTGVEWYRKAAAQGWQESVVALQRYGAIAPPTTLPPTAIVTGIAADDYLSVRSAPAMNSKELFRLSNEQKIQVRGDSVFNGDTEWVPISAESQQGWVRKKYLRLQ
jgi:TPR repeat protein